MKSNRQSIKIFVRNLLVEFIRGSIQLGLTAKTGGRGCGTNVVEYHNLDRRVSAGGAEDDAAGAHICVVKRI